MTYLKVTYHKKPSETFKNIYYGPFQIYRSKYYSLNKLKLENNGWLKYLLKKKNKKMEDNN